MAIHNNRFLLQRTAVTAVFAASRHHGPTAATDHGHQVPEPATIATWATTTSTIRPPTAWWEAD